MKNFNLVVKILIPIAFFIAANVETSTANVIAGIMTILVVAMYAFEYANKPKN